MPGAIMTRDELCDLTGALNQKMCRDAKSTNILKPGVRIKVQAVLKQRRGATRPELSGGQADVVNHQQIGLASRLALVKVA